MADGSTARRRAADGERVEVSGTFDSLPVESSRYVRKGHEVFTVGFPNVGLQGFAPKLSMGIIASLSGARDDFRSFQISNPIQPGNSGGALLDDKGNVIGVVTAKLSQAAAVATTGTLAENVNYAVKSSFLLGFLEAMPEVMAKLRRPQTKELKSSEVSASAEKATVLLLVY